MDRERTSEPERGEAAPSPVEQLARVNAYERLLERRIVFLRGALEETTADDLIVQLLALDHDSHEPVTMLIDSPGGNTYGMFALHDVVSMMQSPVHTRCVGLAASAGAFLLATGTGTRSATANATIMFHQPWGGTGRRHAVDVATQAEHFAQTRRRMQTVLAERTGRSFDELERDLDRDHYLTAEQALAYGAIDEVVPTRPRTSVVPSERVGRGGGGGADRSPPGTPDASAAPDVLSLIHI